MILAAKCFSVCRCHVVICPVSLIICLNNFFKFHAGHGGSRAAEYLKEHLFENLMKHPKFLTDTRLAISVFACSHAPFHA